MAEALVGHVQKGCEVFAFHNRNHLVPLGCSDVIASGVVAASMQHHDGASGSFIQAGQHAFKIDATFFGVVVSVGVDLEAGIGKQSAVIFPAWVRD